MKLYTKILIMSATTVAAIGTPGGTYLFCAYGIQYENTLKYPNDIFSSAIKIFSNGGRYDPITKFTASTFSRNFTSEDGVGWLNYIPSDPFDFNSRPPTYNTWLKDVNNPQRRQELTRQLKAAEVEIKRLIKEVNKLEATFKPHSQYNKTALQKEFLDEILVQAKLIDNIQISLNSQFSYDISIVGLSLMCVSIVLIVLSCFIAVKIQRFGGFRWSKK